MVMERKQLNTNFPSSYIPTLLSCRNTTHSVDSHNAWKRASSPRAKLRCHHRDPSASDGRDDCTFEMRIKYMHESTQDRHTNRINTLHLPTCAFFLGPLLPAKFPSSGPNSGYCARKTLNKGSISPKVERMSGSSSPCNNLCTHKWRRVDE